MKKKIFSVCALGAVFGIVISTVIGIIISWCIGDGSFYACVPSLAEKCGSEIGAVTVQTVFSAIYGAAMAGASLVWQKESWSILRQTLSHLAIISLTTFPVAWFLDWMGHSLGGVLVYFGIFLAVYFIIWLVQYLAMRSRIKKMNRYIKQHTIAE